MVRGGIANYKIPVTQTFFFCTITHFQLYCNKDDKHGTCSWQKRRSADLIRVFAVCHSIVRRFFFYFLVYRSSDPNFCILEKNFFLFLTFFIFSDVKKLPDLKKQTKMLKKHNKNCMILHCKNAEMTILLSFLHFYNVKSYNFCYFFSSDPNTFQIK